jgi:uncharacterized membrane protein
MEALIILFLFALLAGLLVGGICGIIILRKVSTLGRTLRNLKDEVISQQNELRRLANEVTGAHEAEGPETADAPDGGPVAPPGREAYPEAVPSPRPPAGRAARPAKEPAAPPPLEQPPPPPPAAGPRHSLEFILGTRWFVWVGVVLLLVSAVLFVKYAYDNAWIGPQGRLVIGTLAGIAALILGQRFRSREWPVLFQGLTGCGIGLFYICVYAAFSIYGLAGQSTAMALAVLVTALAVVLAVVHNAVSIAILGLLGGMLSPLLLSSGENRPYALFTYLAVLGLTAIGVAIYRRWRVLDLLAFAGTVIIFQLWFGQHYGTGQETPALLFTTLFYLIYLLVPLLHGLVRQTRAPVEALALVMVNALWSAISYYRILHQDHHQVLGFVILGQAVLVYLFFQFWRTRVPEDRWTAESLLILTLGLVTAAIPIQLRLYGIPVAWGMEGLLLTWLGICYRRLSCRVGGLLALLLAAGGLVWRLPLHEALFTPLFNVPFGSWVVVIAAAAGAGWLNYRRGGLPLDGGLPDRGKLPGAAPFYGPAFLLSALLACWLLTMETAQYWDWHRVDNFRAYQGSSLTLLWALLPLAAAWGLHRERFIRPAMPFAWLLFVCGLLVTLAGLEHYDLNEGWLLLNLAFAARLAFVLSLWLGARLTGTSGSPRAGNVLESLGHALLAISLAFEVVRWTDQSTLVTDRLGISLISATLALQAFALIWLGLASKVRLRRIIGFVLFAICVVKVVALDTATLREVYRIVSFLASGLLLIAAAYFYQRYASLLLGTEANGTGSADEEQRP